jgi:hypothetical protein
MRSFRADLRIPPHPGLLERGESPGSSVPPKHGSANLHSPSRIRNSRNGLQPKAMDSALTVRT